MFQEGEVLAGESEGGDNKEINETFEPETNNRISWGRNAD